MCSTHNHPVQRTGGAAASETGGWIGTVRREVEGADSDGGGTAGTVSGDWANVAGDGADRSVVSMVRRAGGWGRLTVGGSGYDAAAGGG